jgi:hypothetical protein
MTLPKQICVKTDKLRAKIFISLKTWTQKQVFLVSLAIHQSVFFQTNHDKENDDSFKKKSGKTPKTTSKSCPTSFMKWKPATTVKNGVELKNHKSRQNLN